MHPRENLTYAWCIGVFWTPSSYFIVFCIIKSQGGLDAYGNGNGGYENENEMKSKEL